MMTKGKSSTAVFIGSVAICLAAAVSVLVSVFNYTQNAAQSSNLIPEKINIVQEEMDNRDPEQAILYGLNTAMQENDREAFVSWGVGEGQQQLANWWDVTKQIGWDHASVDGGSYGSGVRSSADPFEVEWFFSSELGAKIVTLIPEERGLVLTQGEYYNLIVEGSGEDTRISSMVSRDYLYAWSYLDNNVHVAKRENSVTVGKASEAAYVESKADVINSAASKALEAWTLLGGEELPTDGLLVQVSEDQGVLEQWVGAVTSIEYSGLAVTSNRPLNNQPYIDPQIATGDRTSGSLLLMSPRADSEWSNGYESVAFHEAIHAFHRSAYPMAPTKVANHDIGGAEGLAVHAQMRYLTPGNVFGVEYFDYVLDNLDGKEFITTLGYSAFDSGRLQNPETSTVAYAAAGLAMAYAEANGFSPWSIALADSSDENTNLREVLTTISSGALTEAGYVEFVKNY